MDPKIPLVVISMALSVVTGLVIARGRGDGAGPARAHAVVIGLSLDTLKEARWQADREWALTGIADQDVPLPTSPYTGALVLADSLDDVHAVREEITVIGFATSAPEHLVASVRPLVLPV